MEVLPKVLYDEVGFLLLHFHLFLYFRTQCLQALRSYCITQLLRMHGHLLPGCLVLNAEPVDQLLSVLYGPLPLLFIKGGHELNLSEPAVVVLLSEATAFEARVVSRGRPLPFFVRVDRIIL